MTIALPWKTWLVALALLAAAVFLWNRERRLRTDAERGEEAARLELRNQVVENAATKKELRGKVDELLANNDLLRQAYEEAARAAPDATAVSASRLDTGAIAVKDAPRSASVSSGPVERAAPAATSPAASEPACALAPGDAVSVTVDAIELKTSAGNTLAVGTASVYREQPPPRALLAAGKFQSALSRSVELETARPPRWGVLALGACGFSGCGLGAGVLLPPVTLPLVGWRAEALVGGLVVPGGPLVLGGLGGRF